MKHPIVHFEIPADDVERAQKFYTTAFGWDIKKIEMPANSSTKGEPYYIVHTAETDENGMSAHPGTINGGLMKRMSSGQTFMNYIYTENIDELLQKVTDAGGTICMPKTPIAENMGYIACFKDTEGNMMGLHEIPEHKHS